MNAKGLSLAAGAFLLLLGQSATATLPVPATGANVDESRVTKILYVDPAHTEAADDATHGMANAPFATLKYACEAAAAAKDAGVGVKLLLAAGTYREQAIISPPRAGTMDTEAPLVIEAAEREQAVIDGADTEGWSPSTWKMMGKSWTHPWPFHHGVAPARRRKPPGEIPGDAYLRGDLVFVNDTAFRELNDDALLSLDATWQIVAAKPGGSRGGAPSNLWTGTLAVLHPPLDTELPGSIIQVGVRRCGLSITRRRNVVVRGLLIQHAAAPGGDGEKTAGLVLDGCANVLVEDVLSQWNDGSGTLISGQGEGDAGYTLRRVRLLHNGGSGLEVSGVRNLLAEDNETSFNNFRGDWAGWIDPQGPAAVKAQAVRGSTWRRQHAIGNACRGLWWAGGDTDVTVEDAVVRDNVGSGLGLENDPGPVLVRRCLVAGTKGRPGARDDAVPPAGVTLTGTPDVILESNVLADNAAAQLFLLADATGETNLRAERHVYRHNVFFGAEAGESLYRLPAAGLEGFYASLVAEQNCFWNPAKAEVFEGFSYRAATRKTPAAYSSHGSNLEDWRAAMQGATPGIEAGSRWQDPLFVDAREGDYRIRKDSPVADWGLPSDEAAAGQ